MDVCDSLSPNSSSLDVQNMLLKPLRGQDLCGINNPECSVPEIQPCCRICSTQLGDQKTAETQMLWLVCREGFSSQGPPQARFSPVPLVCPSPSLLKINFASDITPLTFLVLSPWEKAGSGRWSTGSKGKKENGKYGRK